MKIVLIGDAGRYRDTLAASLTVPADITILPPEAAVSHDFDPALEGADMVVTMRYRRDGAGPRFRLLHVPGAGLDNIDMASLAPGTRVCNAFEHEAPIAEFVFLAMLEWEIKFFEMRARMAENWSDAFRGRVPHGELMGKTIGLIGFGRIGRAVAERAIPFGMRVLAMGRTAGAPGPAGPLLGPDDLPRLLAQADYIVISCPLTEATRGLIDARAIARMKPSAVLINVSRGPIADEKDLYEALKSGRIAGAFLDVWYRYPADAKENVPPSQFDFLSLPNVYATPHSSAWTGALPGRRIAVVAENIRRLAAGEALVNLVHQVPGA